MNILNYDHHNDHGSDETKNNSTISILSEMKLLGIDYNPLLEIAAKDLSKKFGDLAYDYSIHIQQSFIINQDLGSAEIWAKISNILLLLNQEHHNKIH